MTKSASKITAAIIQHPPVFLNLNASIDKAVEYIEEAAKKGAELIAFPETWLPGYPLWIDSAPNAAIWGSPEAKSVFNILVQNSLEIPSQEFTKLLNAAKQTGTYVIMGANEKEGGTIYNTLIYIDKDGEYKIHRKLVPTYTERLVWGRGDGSTLNSMDTEFGVVGGLICWEHWMPFARAVMHQKNEVIHLCQWPGVHDLHQLASRHYAFEGQCFVLAAGTYITKQNVLDGFDSLQIKKSDVRKLLESINGNNKTVLYNGGSAFIAPDTSYITEPMFGKSKIIFAELNLELINEGKLTLDSSGHYSRPDVFTLNVNDDVQSNIKYKSE
ncbi:MAG: carbon-nitrogen hydrolase family protein [Ignavibacteriae bacterium]|nr:carbon-nitrogen hydrolase family protein [Ignavibacteriota bacterium]NOG99309.1 carbon-nitrogen hydrolase family protein [Ignavibacteriota bacterium]